MLMDMDEVQGFEICVTGKYENDTMICQITEAVQIENMDFNILMSDRAEWNMTPLPRTFISLYEKSLGYMEGRGVFFSLGS